MGERQNSWGIGDVHHHAKRYSRSDKIGHEDNCAVVESTKCHSGPCASRCFVVKNSGAPRQNSGAPLTNSGAQKRRSGFRGLSVLKDPAHHGKTLAHHGQTPARRRGAGAWTLPAVFFPSAREASIDGLESCRADGKETTENILRCGLSKMHMWPWDLEAHMTDDNVNIF